MTSIEWTEKTWNPIVGCSIVSPGCTNCYAMKMAARIERMQPDLDHYRGLTKESKAGPVWTGKLAMASDHTLTEPLRRKKPTMWFVNSMSDLFHEDVPDAWIDRVFAVMALSPQHTFQVLTKRSARMRAYISNPNAQIRVLDAMFGISDRMACQAAHDGQSEPWKARPKKVAFVDDPDAHWPLVNVWLGVSCERQQEADARIPDLLATPAAVRFVSAEPLLGPVDFTTEYLRDKCGGKYPFPMLKAEDRTTRLDLLDWIIVGGESGPNARPMHPDWARSIRDQCTAAGVPFFFKQWGEWLVGVRQPPNEDMKWHPDVAFGDGSAFAVVSDGDDILLGAAEDEENGPKHLWRQYWGWKGHLIKRVGKSAGGRLLDFREWSEMPSAREPAKEPA